MSAAALPLPVPRGRSPLVERWLFLYLPLLFALIFLIGPFYWMAITALKPDGELYDPARSPLYVSSPTLTHFVYLFTETDFLLWTRNTLLVSVLSTIVALGMGIPAGYALARFKFRGAGLVGTAIFVTYLVPTSLLFIPMVNVMATLGLDDSIWALVVVYPTFLVPFVTWLMSGYFRTIPTELEDCARIDGLTRFSAMWRIALPLAKPGILSAAIFAFTLSWNEFIYASVLVSDLSVRTIPTGIPNFIVEDVFFWGPMMASTLISAVPPLVVYFLFQRFLITGLTLGAVKG